MTAALLILVVMVAVAGLLNPSREQFAWFIRLRRPAWLTFEGLIPLIWLTIYACYYGSALLSWNASWRACTGRARRLRNIRNTKPKSASSKPSCRPCAGRR